MCGIFGITGTSQSRLPINILENTLNNLFKLSSSRGSEASGIAIKANHSIEVLLLLFI